MDSLSRATLTPSITACGPMATCAPAATRSRPGRQKFSAISSGTFWWDCRKAIESPRSRVIAEIGRAKASTQRKRRNFYRGRFPAFPITAITRDLGDSGDKERGHAIWIIREPADPERHGAEILCRGESHRG